MKTTKSKATDSTSISNRLVHFTPLRYPGGKGKLAAFIKDIIIENALSDGDYAEPYAGGAAVALELLLQGYVSHIHINDVSRHVYAFWWSVLERTDELCRLIRNARLNLTSWSRQKRIVMNPEESDNLRLGFATFFLNRTNRSGILNGGVIGGKEQKGPWKIDARYNAEELIRRIEAIANLQKRISLSREDAVVFIRRRLRTLPEKTLMYLDPPYYEKGKDLYYDFYRHEDHEEIADVITSVTPQRWIVSYDNAPQIRKMYRGHRKITYDIGYSAREVKTGSEVMYFAPRMKVPPAVGPMVMRA